MRSSIIFGTDGHKAAGTNENDTPRIAMIATANTFDGKIGKRNAKLRWQAIIMSEPTISIDAALPFLSIKPPRNGVRSIARIGKQLNNCAPLSMPRVLSR